MSEEVRSSSFLFRLSTPAKRFPSLTRRVNCIRPFASQDELLVANDARLKEVTLIKMLTLVDARLINAWPRMLTASELNAQLDSERNWAGNWTERFQASKSRSD